MKNGSKTEFAVGIFFILGICALGYLVVNLGGTKLSDSGSYSVTAQFINASGINEGSAVEIAGVKVGEVSSIALEGTNALVMMRIENNVTLRDDDVAAIRTKGIIGDRFIKIIPGASEELVTENGEIFDTESAVELEEILGKFIHSME